MDKHKKWETLMKSSRAVPGADETRWGWCQVNVCETTDRKSKNEWPVLLCSTFCCNLMR